MMYISMNILTVKIAGGGICFTFTDSPAVVHNLLRCLQFITVIHTIGENYLAFIKLMPT